jgi:tRNA threonylcarbamoyladenosine biosynthesis protein TsaB
VSTEQSSAVLAIDTSGSFCSIALSVGRGAILHRESSGDGDHFEQLPSMVAALLEQAGIQSSELSEIRIGTGPGSFTGLRIGMSFAKGLAVAVEVPLAGVSSFDGVAWFSSLEHQLSPGVEIAVVSDARRDEVFIATYALGPSGALQRLAPCIVSVAELEKWQEANPGGLVVTPLLNFTPVGVSNVRQVSRVAEGLLAVEPVERHRFSLEGVALLEPNYIRAVAAKSIAERRES